jgi:hypothetical protein
MAHPAGQFCDLPGRFQFQCLYRTRTDTERALDRLLRLGLKPLAAAPVQQAFHFREEPYRLKAGLLQHAP